MVDELASQRHIIVADGAIDELIGPASGWTERLRNVDERALRLPGIINVTCFAAGSIGVAALAVVKLVIK